MTNLITLTIPNDDHVALRAFGKALEEIALAHGAEPRDTTVGEITCKLNIDTTEAAAALERLNNATGELMQAAPNMMQELHFEGDELQGKRKEPEIDTTAQQVESLGEAVLTVNGVEIDSEPADEVVITGHDKTGTPWDERIHSASKALNSDGTWRLRRKPKDMDEAEWAALVESVKAELTGADSTGEEVKALETVEILKSLDEDKLSDSEPDTGALVGNIEPPVTPPGDDFHTDTEVVSEETVAAIPPIPVPPPVVVPPVPHTIPVTVEVINDWDFPKLMTFLTERHGKIDVATVNMLLAGDGLSSIQELNAHPDKIGPFVARVKAHLGE